MRKKYLPSYAQYFVKCLEGYSKEGVTIHAVTVQNEVDTDQDGRMPAALWGQEYEIEFVKKHLGPALEQASLDTKIWILDHNYSLWGRALDELSDPEFSRYVDGVAWHAYAGTPDAMTRVHEAFPMKNTYWTEGGPSYRSTEYADRMGQVVAYIRRNSAQLGAMYRGVEPGVGRRGATQYWSGILRRSGDAEFADARSDTQRPVLGVRSLFEVCSARRAGN